MRVFGSITDLFNLVFKRGGFDVTMQTQATYTGAKAIRLPNIDDSVDLVGLFDSTAAATTSLDNELVRFDGTTANGIQPCFSTPPTLSDAGILTINNTTASTNKDDGCLVLQGGLGVEGAINTGGAITVGTGLTVTTGNITLSGAGATVDGIDVSAHATATTGVHGVGANTIAHTGNKLSAFAATTSAELAGVISDETGSGVLVFGTSPTFTTSIITPKVTNAGTLTLEATGSGNDVQVVAADDFLVTTGGTTASFSVTDSGGCVLGPTGFTGTHTLNGVTTSLQAASAGVTYTITESSDTGNFPARFIARRSRGSSLSSPTAVQSGNMLGGLEIQGYDGSAYASGVSIYATCGATWSGSTHQSKLIVDGCNTSSTSPTTWATCEDGTWKNTSGTWSTLASDRNLKKNITPLNDSLTKILALKPCTYEFINTDTHQAGTLKGFIAQEVEEVFPDLVRESDPMSESDKALLGDGVKQKSYDNHFIPDLVKAIQEQHTIIQALTVRISALETK